jgi:integrase
MSKFRSFLAPHIESFIAYRKASENWNINYEHMLRSFDKYCATFYSDAEFLLQEMVDNWSAKKDTENYGSCRKRIYALVNMILYLRARGETNVNPPAIPRGEKSTYIPHAFTEEELVNFFNACDDLPSTPKRLDVLSRKITLPIFFRLLYSSGIRTNEARILRVADVDLQHGVIDIQYSKGHDQHYIVLHDSMLILMQQYDKAIKKLYPNRTYFFPAKNDKHHGKLWLQENFQKLWGKRNHARATAYALRHNYAVTNINNWIGEGLEFADKFLYLSKSMGHRKIESTKYYYSIVPGLSDILEQKTNTDFEDIVPEVRYDCACSVSDV